VIGSVATLVGAFGSSGRFQEVDINHIDHDMCNKFNDGDIVDSVMLCVGCCVGTTCSAFQVDDESQLIDEVSLL
jgi:hypothetical protein